MKHPQHHQIYGSPSLVPPDRWREARKACSLTLKELAQQTDSSIGYLNRVENGYAKPKDTFVLAVSYALKNTMRQRQELLTSLMIGGAAHDDSDI